MVTVFEAAGFTVSETKIETMLLRTPDQTTLASPLEIDRRTRLVRTCLKRFGLKLYDRATAPLTLKVRMPKVKVIETLLYGCAMYTLRANSFAKLRTTHYQSPLAGHWLPAPTSY